MHKNHNGSMVLTCMFFISIVMVIMLLHWRSEESLQTIMIMRAKMARAQYACEALMDYGIDIGKHRYGLLRGRGRSLILSFDRWPLGNEEYGQGILEITHAKQLEIRATISQDKCSLVRLSCNLERRSAFPRNIFTVYAWKRQELSE